VASKQWRTSVKIESTNTDKRLVYGWLYVAKTKDGEQVVDHSGEFVENDEILEKAAIDFAMKYRAASVMHKRICNACNTTNSIKSVRANKCAGCAKKLYGKNSVGNRPVVVGELIEVVTFTTEKCKALGIPDGTMPCGIWVGFHVVDDDAWAGVKSGKFKMLSFGGAITSQSVEE